MTEQVLCNGTIRGGLVGERRLRRLPTASRERNGVAVLEKTGETGLRGLYGGRQHCDRSKAKDNLQVRHHCSSRMSGSWVGEATTGETAVNGQRCLSTISRPLRIYNLRRDRTKFNL